MLLAFVSDDNYALSSGEHHGHQIALLVQMVLLCLRWCSSNELDTGIWNP